jgi:hypothetical protein
MLSTSKKTLVNNDQFICYSNLSANLSVIHRLISNFWGYEKLSYCVQNAFSNPMYKNLMTSCQYIYFEETSKMEGAIQEVITNKDVFLDAYANPLLSQRLVVTNNYTFYILEILNGLTSFDVSNKVYETYVQQITPLMKNGNIASRKNVLLAYLNLPTSIQDKEDIKTKFDISPTLHKFMVLHPVFMSVYLTSNNPDIYGNIIKMFFNILDQQKEFKKVVMEPKQYTLDKLKLALKYLENNISLLKQCLLTLQIADMYTNQYKTELTLKPRGGIKDTRYPNYTQFVSKIGYKTLTNEQIISKDDYKGFFKSLFTPFYLDLIEGRIFTAWRRAFEKQKFNPQNNTGYWREFRSLYVDYFGRVMNQVQKDIWAELKRSTIQPRWGKRDEFDKTFKGV